MRYVALLIVSVFVMTVSVFADEAPPKATPKPRSVQISMTVMMNGEAKEARLLIPKSYLRSLRAELDDPSAADEHAALRSRTVVGGVLMSIAFVFGGVWFFRNGNVKAVAAGLALIALGAAGASMVFGNAGPPPQGRSITGKLFDPEVRRTGFAYGKVRLEASDAENVQLIVPNPPEAETKKED